MIVRAGKALETWENEGGALPTLLAVSSVRETTTARMIDDLRRCAVSGGPGPDGCKA